MAKEIGLPGIYFLAHVNSMDWDAVGPGFDAIVPHNPGITTWFHFNPPANSVCESPLVKGRKPDIMKYRDYIELALPVSKLACDAYPCVVPNWDTTPRCALNGMVLEDSTPELFEKHLSSAINQVIDKTVERRLVFIKSWNEWGEGNYLEPDLTFGRGYLEACGRAVHAANGDTVPDYRHLSSDSRLSFLSKPSVSI
jgi:hypothetical protein